MPASDNQSSRLRVGAPVGWVPAQLADHDAGHLGTVRLHVVGIDAVVADHRRRHHDDLPEIAGSVNVSWYPVRLVVKTTSPNAGSIGRALVPGNHAPSSSKTKAGRSVIRSPRARSSSLLWLGWSRGGSGGRGPEGFAGAGPAAFVAGEPAGFVAAGGAADGDGVAPGRRPTAWSASWTFSSTSVAGGRRASASLLRDHGSGPRDECAVAAADDARKGVVGILDTTSNKFTLAAFYL